MLEKRQQFFQLNYRKSPSQSNFLQEWRQGRAEEVVLFTVALLLTDPERDLARDRWRALMKYNCGLTRSMGIWTTRSLASVAKLGN